jgi:hypothetical protein
VGGNDAATRQTSRAVRQIAALEANGPGISSAERQRAIFSRRTQALDHDFRRPIAAFLIPAAELPFFKLLKMPAMGASSKDSFVGRFTNWPKCHDRIGSVRGGFVRE